MLPTANQIFEAVGCSWANAQRFAEPIRETCALYQINTPRRISAFLANVGHETTSLSAMVENLNYSEQRLREVCLGAPVGSRWRSLLPRVKDLARQPQKLAEAAYGGRMGNRPEGSGDGWKYIGRCPVHVTGLFNYEAITEAIHRLMPTVPDFTINPEKLEEPYWGSIGAGAFWDENGINELADGGQVDKITRRVNGGMSGKADRRARYSRAMRVLAH